MISGQNSNHRLETAINRPLDHPCRNYYKTAPCNVAQEPNRNPLSRNRKRNRNRRNCFPVNGTETRTSIVPLCQTEPKGRKALSPEEPLEPKTGTARTVPPPNRNRTEPSLQCPWKILFCSCLAIPLACYRIGFGPEARNLFCSRPTNDVAL